MANSPISFDPTSLSKYGRLTLVARTVVEGFLNTLEKTQPGGETSMAPIWHNLAGQIKRRGMVVILSDCFDQLGPLMQALRHFRHGQHEVLLFHILAPEEIEFPFRKWTQFRNLEVARHKLLVDPQRLRREYLQNFQTFCKQL